MMKEALAKSRIALAGKEALEKLLAKIPFLRGNMGEYILKKYKGHFFIAALLVFLSLFSHFLPRALKERERAFSPDSLVPKGFVLLAIEISNGKDIRGLIGPYGVIDLYAYSQQTGLPDEQAGSAIKVLPPEEEEGLFSALVPEKEAGLLFEYSKPFYAVIQNPSKTGSKIHKKRRKKSLIVIEENF